MITEFKANQDEKEKLVQLRRRDDEKVAYLRKGKKITGIFVVAAPILMLLYGLLCPSLSVFAMETGDIGDKNIIVIFLLAIAVCAICLYIHIMARIFLYNISAFNILDRLEESMFLEGTQLEYGYHLRDSINIRDRVKPHFDLLSMKRIVYDSKFKRLSMWGKFHSVYYSNYSLGLIEKEGDMDTEEPYDIYMYFEPDLLAELQSRGVPIEIV